VLRFVLPSSLLPEALLQLAEALLPFGLQRLLRRLRFVLRALVLRSGLRAVVRLRLLVRSRASRPL
jgi:hypothetical protein